MSDGLEGGSHQSRIPEDYPGTARTDRGDAVTGQLEAKPLDNGEHLLRIWTEDRDGPIQLALTPTQVRQWHAQFKICDHRVGIMQSRQQPDLDDTVLTSIIGKSFHDPHADACAAVNAYDTAIENETTVREAVEEGKEPCRHCYDYDHVDPDELRQEVRFRD